METKGLCYGCNLPIGGGKHYHRELAPDGSGSCYTRNRKRLNKDSLRLVRKQGAALNGGKEIGAHCRDVSDRFEPLTIRSRKTVANMMGLTVSGVRVIELRAMAKIRAALMPFKNAYSGRAKINQVTQPIPSLAD